MKHVCGIIALLVCNLINMHAIQPLASNVKNISEHELIKADTNLNAAIAYLCDTWQLSNVQPFIYPSVFDNYIARAYSSIYQQEVVIKISESNDECTALQLLQSDGMVKLIDCDHEYRALLLQYIPSQITLLDFLQTHDDDWIINAFAQLFKKIHASPKIVNTTDFKTIQDNFSFMHTHTFIKIPENLLKKALRILTELCTSNEPEYLLHADLHCRNILQFEDAFIAIDPWALVGPLEYEVASFVSSPTDFLLAQDNPGHILQNRLNRLTELLQLNKKLLKNCAFLRVIFLACLCEARNKNDDWITDFIQIAELIDQLDDNR